MEPIDRYYDPNPLGIPTAAALDTADLMVNSPPHYNSGTVETINYITQVTKNYSGDEGYLIGNVLKYVSRAPLKGDKVKDLKKAQWYLNRLVESL